MKRVITLLMAAVMLIGTAGLASAAVEFKASGHMHILFGLKDNGADTKFNKDAGEDNFYAGQRFRPKLTMKAEGVTAVFEAQQHQKYWGTGFTTSSPSADVRVRNAYIDWKVPGTPVSLKMGFQQLNLPSIWGHPVFENRVGAVVATIPVNDQIAVAAFWARPADAIGDTYDWTNAAGEDKTTTVTSHPHNSIDMFGALVPMNFGMVKATPYFVYAKLGSLVSSQTGTSAPVINEAWNNTLIVGGVNLALAPMDALSVKVDAIVTNHKNDAPSTVTGDKAAEQKTGFMFAAAVDYEMPFGTPGVFAWYATGADDKGEGGFFGYSTDGFCPTSLGYEGYATFDLGAWAGSTGASTMGVGAQVADMSFINSLKHTIRVAYIMGTADEDISGSTNKRAGKKDAWTTEDSFIEVNLDSNWSIYENLSAAFDMGLLLPDFGKATKASGFEDDMAWRAQVTFKFAF